MPEQAIKPEVSESGNAWPIFVEVGQGKIKLEHVGGQEFRFSREADRPEVKTARGWERIKGGLPQKLQERYIPRWERASKQDQPSIEREAQDFYQYLLVVKSTHHSQKNAAKSIESQLARHETKSGARKFIDAEVKRRGVTRAAAQAELKQSMLRWQSELSLLRQRIQSEQEFLEPFEPSRKGLTKAPEAVPVPEAPEEMVEAVEAFDVADDPLGVEIEEGLPGEPDELVTVSAAEAEALAPTTPQAELEKTLVRHYGEEQGVTDFREWMLKTLRDEAGPGVLTQLEKEAVVGLAAGTIERQPPSELVPAYAAAKVEQDRIVAELKAPGGEIVVGDAFAAEVAKVVEAEQPKVKERRFLPRFVIERLRSTILGEFSQALRFRLGTDRIAREYLQSVQNSLLPSSRGTAPEGSASVVDGALAQLRERLGHLRSYSGEGMQQRLAAKEVEVRQLLEQELGSANLITESDTRALAVKLRNAIDQRYWHRYIWGAAELAVAGAVGGYFAFAKGAAATKAAVIERGGRSAGKRALSATARRIIARKVPVELPGISTSLPPELRDQVAAHGSLWATVRRAAEQAGLKPTNEQLMRATAQVAKENDIAVGAWGIAGKIKDTAMPDGLVLKGVHGAVRALVAAVG